jgi:hypothetical protein
MPQATIAHHTDRIGVHAVAKIVHEELRWIFREQHEDFGIDAQIEVVTNCMPTGKLLAVQIKSGPGYFAQEDAQGIMFRGELHHLEYWLKHDLPVIVVLYDPAGGVAYWKSVTAESVSRTPNGWKMSIPRTQRVEVAQAANLEKLASKREQLEEALKEYKCPHCGAPLMERAGVWLSDACYGLCEVFECGYRTGDSMTEQPCPSDPKFPRFEDYELKFHESGEGPTKSCLCIAVGKTAMAKRLRLRPASGKSKDEVERAVRADYDRCAKTWHCVSQHTPIPEAVPARKP